MELIVGAVAGAGAALFTHPMDVIKTRLQLQGELAAPGSYKRVYKNTFHAFYLIARSESFKSIQAGLGPSVVYSMFLGTRLGFYKLALNYEFMYNESGRIDALRSLLVSTVTSSIAAGLGSPLFLVKVQMQSQASAHTSVGTHHGHEGTWSALKSIWKNDGIRGLYRDSHINIPRVAFGSAFQLTTYGLALDWFRESQIFDDRPMLKYFCSSFIASVVLVVTTHPFEMILTRLYNQS